MTCCQKDRERGELGILVFNKANEIIMHSVDYKEFNLEELAGPCKNICCYSRCFGSWLSREGCGVCVCACAHVLVMCICSYAFMHGDVSITRNAITFDGINS